MTDDPGRLVELMRGNGIKADRLMRVMWRAYWRARRPRKADTARRGGIGTPSTLRGNGIKAGEGIDYTGALGAFLRIKDADGVREFARRYGPLALCAHGVPATHNPTVDDPVGIDRGLGCRPVYTEPVAAWLRLAAQARAILDVAASLHHNRRPDARSWRLAMGYGEDGTGATAPTPIDSERLADYREWLSIEINGWLRLDPPRPVFRWRPRPDVVLVCGTFGHIALQLAAACAGTADLMRCDSCRQPYVRKGRRAQAGRRNYCPGCRDSGAPQRDARRDFRQRQAQQRGRAARRRAGRTVD